MAALKSYVIYQAWDAVIHHQMKHREESWKYDMQLSILDKLRGEIKDAKMNSFLSDFQPRIKN